MWPVNKDTFISYHIIYKLEASRNGETSLSSLVGMVSKRHIDALEEYIIDANSERSIGETM